MSVALWSQLLALASSLSGTVVDPQGLPVAGARVELVCGTRDDTVDTDQRGRFTLTMPSTPGGCRLLVTREGFALFDQGVDDAGDRLHIGLQLADVAQQVDVRAEPRSSRSIGSVFLTGSDVRSVAGTTADLVRHARLLAGGTLRPGVIYVDGLPATVLPPLGMVASISVNADPFTAERADGDVTTIEIITRAPARKLTFHLGSDVLGIGGGDALASDARSASAFQHFGTSGPVPRVPLTFVASMGLGSTSRDVPLQAVVPGAGAEIEAAQSRNRTWSGSIAVHFAPDAPFTARFSYRQSRADGENLGVGGIVLPDAGSSASIATRDARVTATGVARRFLYEGSLLLSAGQWSTRANTDGAGIMIPGEFVTGGDPVSAAATRHAAWTSKHVLRGTSRTRWMAGVTLSGTSDSEEQTPNPAGLFEFANLAAYTRGLAGAESATWFVTRGNASVRHTSVRFAPFAEVQGLVAGRLEVAAGARADYRSGFGTLISPRLSLAARGRGFTARAGAGLFVGDLPGTIFIVARKSDGLHLQRFVRFDTALTGASDPGLRLPMSITSGLAPDLTPPREIMARLSVERHAGPFVPGFEYTWTRARHLTGSERRADGTGWLDLLQSSRAAERHRLHAQLQYAWKGRSLSAQYEWTRARDNTDGPFSHAEQAGNLGAEWARSAGVPLHGFTAMGTCPLPGSISLTVTQAWRSAAPYNITTGLNPAQNGLSVSRGGRSRNSGDGPGYSALDVYAYRRVQLPNILRRAHSRMHANIGVQLQNILDRRNYIGVGSVVGAASFGRPVAAFPGRSFRLSLNID